MTCVHIVHLANAERTHSTTTTERSPAEGFPLHLYGASKTVQIVRMYVSGLPSIGCNHVHILCTVVVTRVTNTRSMIPDSVRHEHLFITNLGGRMKSLDPYAPIEKVPLVSEDGLTKSRGYSVRIADESDGYQEVGVVKEDYLLIPNLEVKQMADDITHQTGLAWSVEKTFFDGKRFVLALATRSERLSAEVVPGDVLSLGLMFENSYDGSRRLSVSLYAHRLVCSNGLILPSYLSRLRFKHAASSTGWEAETKRALSMIVHAGDDLRRFARTANKLTSVSFGMQEMEMIRRRGLAKLPVTLWGKMIDRFLLEEEERTAWSFLQSGNQLVWHNERGSIADFGHNATINSAVLDFYETRGSLMN